MINLRIKRLMILTLPLLLLSFDVRVSEAGRVRLWENNFGYIGDVCQDGVEIAIGNDLSDEDIHAGEGRSATLFRAQDENGTQIADDKMITQTFHEIDTWYGYMSTP